MNWRVVFRLMGVLIVGTAVPMILPILWALWFAEWDSLLGFSATVGLMGGVGSVLMRLGQGQGGSILRREALVVVAVAWFVVPAFGALPFLFDGTLSSPIDAYFESVSGFTTTGASIMNLAEVDMGKATSFWRMQTHWLGGMGIMVLFVAILPSLGVGGKMLFKNEVPGPITEGVKPRIRETSLALWKIYGVLTLAQTVALLVCGMDLHFALGHSMSTLGTGGFSPLPQSIGELQRPAVEWVCLLFMLIGGGNFSLYYYVVQGERRALLRDTETRVYLGLVLISSILVAVTILPRHDFHVHDAVRHALFNVISVVTTTGFASEDFNLYPSFARNILFFLLFVGACTGSTAGGPKIFRYVVIAKALMLHIGKTFRPQMVTTIRVGRQRISDETVNGIFAFMILYLLVFAFGALAMSAMTPNLEMALSGTITCLGNVGPGLGQFGPMGGFIDLFWPGKLLMTVLMILGRLELYTVLVLFVPAFWRR